MSARLGRYLGWQLRDYVAQRGLPLLIVGALILLPTIQSRAEIAADPSGGVAALVLLQLILFFAPVGTLLTINGIIAHDRARGYFRFLFSKPVSVAGYYAQAFLVAGVGLVLATAAFVGAFAALVFPLFPPGALLYVGLYFVALGGIGFLLSAVTRFDWMALGLVWALAQLLRTSVPPDAGWHGRMLDVMLPPVHRLTDAAGPVIRGELPEPGGLLWVLGYGLAAFGLGLLLVRHRPLAP